MGRNNHKNRGWRVRWTCERISRTATHTSGVVARVSPSPTDPAKDRITLERTDQIDTSRWDIGRLTEEAVRLWMDGEF
ncbi:MAG: hypothetical protein M0Z99_13035 [Betaproteobacteria bacterium]|nr:hypothetical protein [Betaproteobacteria bacterium]